MITEKIERLANALSFFRENCKMYNEKNGVASMSLGWIATTGDYVVK